MTQTEFKQIILTEALKLIVHFEGFRYNAYLCPANVWTVGHGWTYHPNGQRVRQGDTMSEATSRHLLRAKIATTATQISQVVRHPLNPHQLAALISFVFNVGMGAFRSSTLKRLLDAGNTAGAAQQFDRWVTANGRRLEGLARRRTAERNLFTKPYSAPAPPLTPTPSKATLRHGMTHPDVVTLQRLLGLPKALQTGFFGNTTANRVRQFQQANGLVADGIVGPATWGKLTQKG